MAETPSMLRRLLLVACALLLARAPSSSAQQTSCASRRFPTNRLFAVCNDLPRLGSSLHYSYNAPASTLSLAFVAVPSKPGGWISWGINPAGPAMIGTQALAAFRRGDGSVVARTYNVSSYEPTVESRIAYEVPNLEAEWDGGNGELRIFATIKLPPGTVKVNQVWQVGPSVDGTTLGKHEFKDDNLMAKGTLDLLKGQSTTGSDGGAKIRDRNIHGILNAVSWGILLPIGALFARYLKTFKSADPAWFYLHVSCQLAGYAVGVAGWATGLKLGNESKGVEYTLHRSMGIAVFCLATLQIFALFLRPNKDHKYRIFWNAYHHATGYAVIILAIINVFKGFKILNPDDKWRVAFITVICVLGGIAFLLEVITQVISRRGKSGAGSMATYASSSNGHDRQQPLNAV